MALYDPLNGVYRKVTKSYDPVEGTYRKVAKAYDDVNGVYRQYFSGDPTAGGLAVGDSIWLKVRNTLEEFLVVHQGNPDSALYDASCDGTWLLKKDMYATWYWNSEAGGNDYANSEIYEYLHNQCLRDIGIKESIKEVKIPYHKGNGIPGAIASGADGLSSKVFLLSAYEVGWTVGDSGVLRFIPKDGACLDYFKGMEMTDPGRIGYYKGSPTIWLLRSPYTASYGDAWAVYENGGTSTAIMLAVRGIRPAFILDRDTPIDQSTGKNIIE